MTFKNILIWLTLIILAITGISGLYIYKYSTNKEQLSDERVATIFIERKLVMRNLWISESVATEFNVECIDTLQNEKSKEVVIGCANTHALSASSSLPGILVGTTRYTSTHPKTPFTLARQSLMLLGYGSSTTVLSCEPSILKETDGATINNTVCSYPTGTIFVRTYALATQPVPTLWITVASKTLTLTGTELETRADSLIVKHILPQKTSFNFWFPFIETVYADDGDSDAVADPASDPSSSPCGSACPCNSTCSTKNVTTGGVCEAAAYTNYPTCGPEVVKTKPICASNTGQTCYSSANFCGVTNSGTIQCDGSCSATTPDGPSGWLADCTPSNVCAGQTCFDGCNTYTGTKDCSTTKTTVVTPTVLPDGCGADTKNNQCCTGTDFWDTASASCQPFWYTPDIFAATPSGCGAGTLNDTCPDTNTANNNNNNTSSNNNNNNTSSNNNNNNLPSGCGPGTLNDLCPTPAIRNQAVNFPNITFICDNSDSYTVVHNETGTTIGQGPTSSGATVSVQFSAEGNYTLTCKSGPLTASAVVNYTIPVLSLSGMTISASPRTVNSSKNTTLSWSVISPTDSCRLRAEAVCTGGRAYCSQAQLSEESSFNSTLKNGKTDANDPYGASRTIQNAVRKVAPENNPTGDRALGKKTLPVGHTTDFVLDCGGGLIKKMRVVVSDENEG